MNTYTTGQSVEVQRNDWNTPGFPLVWLPGTVEDIEEREDGLRGLFIRTEDGLRQHYLSGKRGGCRRVRPAGSDKVGWRK